MYTCVYIYSPIYMRLCIYISSYIHVTEFSKDDHVYLFNPYPRYSYNVTDIPPTERWGVCPPPEHWAGACDFSHQWSVMEMSMRLLSLGCSFCRAFLSLSLSLSLSRSTFTLGTYHHVEKFRLHGEAVGVYSGYQPQQGFQLTPASSTRYVCMCMILAPSI